MTTNVMLMSSFQSESSQKNGKLMHVCVVAEWLQVVFFLSLCRWFNWRWIIVLFIAAKKKWSMCCKSHVWIKIFSFFFILYSVLCNTWHEWYRFRVLWCGAYERCWRCNDESQFIVFWIGCAHLKTKKKYILSRIMHGCLKWE